MNFYGTCLKDYQTKIEIVTVSSLQSYTLLKYMTLIDIEIAHNLYLTPWGLLRLTLRDGYNRIPLSFAVY